MPPRVGDDRDVGVRLQYRRRHLGGDRSAQRGGQRVCLARPGGQQQDRPGAADRCQSLGDRLSRDGPEPAAEESGVVAAGLPDSSTTRVVESSGEPGSLNARWPLEPMPAICTSTPSSATPASNSADAAPGHRCALRHKNIGRANAQRVGDAHPHVGRVAVRIRGGQPDVLVQGHQTAPDRSISPAPLRRASSAYSRVGVPPVATPSRGAVAGSPASRASAAAVANFSSSTTVMFTERALSPVAACVVVASQALGPPVVTLGPRRDDSGHTVTDDRAAQGAGGEQRRTDGRMVGAPSDRPTPPVRSRRRGPATSAGSPRAATEHAPGPRWPVVAANTSMQRRNSTTIPVSSRPADVADPHAQPQPCSVPVRVGSHSAPCSPGRQIRQEQRCVVGGDGARRRQ